MTTSTASVLELHQNTARKFNNRCLICFQPYEVIHHINPKSSRPKDFDVEENLAPLCNSCHEKVHADGAAKWIRPLELLRKVRLEYFGDNRYISINNIRLALPVRERKPLPKRKKKV